MKARTGREAGNMREKIKDATKFPNRSIRLEDALIDLLEKQDLLIDEVIRLKEDNRELSEQIKSLEEKVDYLDRD